MKTLSVLFTFALLVAANQLAQHLKHAHALPDTTQSEYRAIDPRLAASSFHKDQYFQ